MSESDAKIVARLHGEIANLRAAINLLNRMRAEDAGDALVRLNAAEAQVARLQQQIIATAWVRMTEEG